MLCCCINVVRGQHQVVQTDDTLARVALFIICFVCLILLFAVSFIYLFILLLGCIVSLEVVLLCLRLTGEDSLCDLASVLVVKIVR